MKHEAILSLASILFWTASVVEAGPAAQTKDAGTIDAGTIDAGSRRELLVDRLLVDTNPNAAPDAKYKAAGSGGAPGGLDALNSLLKNCSVAKIEAS